MAIIKSGASTDELNIDPVSKAARVTQYDSAGRELTNKATFAVSGTFTPPATPTDMLRITGSASKTVRLVSMSIATTNTAAGSQQFFVIKRSADNTLGTFIPGTPVPFDSNDVATAVAGHYTANPVALGAAVGTVSTRRVASPAPVPASFAGVREDAGQELLFWGGVTDLDKRVTLRGTAQILVLNFAGAALVAGQTHAYTIVWTEES